MSVQKENGYTSIANELMDALSKYRVPGEQRQCLDFVLRKTYGWNKKWDKISLSQFTKGTGLKRPNVVRALKSLVLKKIVLKNDTTYTTSYQFNKKYEQWEVVSKKIPLKSSIKSDNQVVSKVIHTKETNTKEIYKFKKLVEIPSDFHLIGKMIEYAKQKNYNGDIEYITETFVLHHTKVGSKFKNWYSAWQMWLRNDIKWNGNKQRTKITPDGTKLYWTYREFGDGTGEYYWGRQP